MIRLQRTPDRASPGRGFLLFRAGDATMSPSSTEIAGLSRCIANADEQIDAALDDHNRRAFHLWCQRRKSLIARRERALMTAALEVPA